MKQAKPGDNQDVTQYEMDVIRRIDDKAMRVLLTATERDGWQVARKLFKEKIVADEGEEWNLLQQLPRRLTGHAEYDVIRRFEDFDLEMLISEVNDHGLLAAGRMMQTMASSIELVPESECANYDNIQAFRVKPKQ